MVTDLYNLCPCGNGEKLKYCCNDLSNELEKILAKIKGEQRLAALQEVERLLGQHPKNPALLSLRCSLLLQLEELGKVAEAIEQFVTACPGNPSAHAYDAIWAALQKQPNAAIGKLQKSFENLGKSLSPQVYEAISLVSQSLLEANNLLAARGHLSLQAILAGENDPLPLQLLTQINSAPQVPLLLKQDFLLEEAANATPYAQEFTEAFQLAAAGRWANGKELFRKLDKNNPGQYPILKNIAILASWLGDLIETVEAWRGVASSEGCSEEEAIEAEALAQLIDAKTYEDQLDVVKIEVTLSDGDGFLERLSSEKLVEKMPIDPQLLKTEDSNPPPKAAYWLLDKPIPELSDKLTLKETPLVLGEMLYYGKQTDREARLDCIVTRDDNFATVQQHLKDLSFGMTLRKEQEEEVIGQVSAVSHLLNWNYHLPAGIDEAKKKELAESHRKETILKGWLNRELSTLDGKTPLEASKNPSLKTKLEASLFLLELMGEQNEWTFDFDELRKTLSLEKPSNLSFDVEVGALPLVRLSRLSAELLPDDDLSLAFRRATMSGARRAARMLGNELIKRDGTTEATTDYVYGMFARLANDPGEALELLAKAKEVAKEKGRPVASYLIAELDIRLEQRQVQEVQQLLGVFQTEYAQDAEVSRAVYQILVQHGVISPQGMPPGMSPGAPAVGTPGPASPSVTQPGMESSEPQKTSKLWVPGME
ncbi:MAG: hypothetical protein MPJ24_02600 [Pirellulaceae bacterium]|nr:hypothetical protein [Pirellulaceae bacterium]